MKTRSILAAWFIAAAIPVLASADVVLLNNNLELVGDVTENGDTYVVVTATGTVRLEKTDVVSVKKSRQTPGIQSESQVADLRHKAEQGDIDAEVKLADAYRLGIGIAVDAVQAAKLYRKALDAGNESVMVQLGVMYAAGQVVPRDKAEGIIWLGKGVEAGHGTCMAALGFMYLNGRGAPKDPAQALKLFQQGADAGNQRCMAGLGHMYLNGLGVEIDETQAVKLIRKGVEGGDPFAMANLGICYDEGRGVPRDYEQAEKWFRKAAAAANGLAMFRLGTMYKAGQGVTRNDDEAARWFRKAAAADYQPPTTQPAAVAGTAVGNLLVSWEIPGWTPATKIGGDNPIAKSCSIQLERSFPNMSLYAGIAVGDAVKSKDDSAYDRFLASTLDSFTAGLPNKTPASRSVRQVNGIEFDSIAAHAGLKVARVYVGIQAGHCISYWYVGNPTRLDEFEKAIGQASITAEARQ